MDNVISHEFGVFGFDDMIELEKNMKVVCLFGKSASGKDTVYRNLLKRREPDLKTVTLYTTRPMRDGEQEGGEYFFISEDQAEKLRASGKVIEERTYHTVYGPWTYMTVDDGQFRENENYLVIGTLESYCSIRDYFGASAVIPVYLEVEDGLRLERAIARERTQNVPKYEEMCRRFLADSEDFSEDRLKEAGISLRFYNDDPDACTERICRYLKDQIR